MTRQLVALLTALAFITAALSLRGQDDPASRRAAIEAMYPVMVRALDAKLSGSYRSGTVAGYFNDVDRCVAELGKLTSAKGVS